MGGKYSESDGDLAFLGVKKSGMTRDSDIRHSYVTRSACRITPLLNSTGWKIVLIEELAQQKAMMVRHLLTQGTLQLGNLPPQLALGKLSQNRGIRFASNQCLYHGAPETPNTSLATEPSLMLAVSSTF